MIGLDCAHRTSTASSCAFCEQRGRSPAALLSHLPLPRRIWKLPEGMVGLSSTARTFSPTRPGRAKTRPCPCEGLLRPRVARAERSTPPSLFLPSLPKDREAFCKGAVAGFYCAHRTSTVSSCAFCEQGSRQYPYSPTRTLFSELPDTPLQSSPNPSETDPYPSTPSSSDPKSGRCPAKSHRPGSACRCASQTPI